VLAPMHKNVRVNKMPEITICELRFAGTHAVWVGCGDRWFFGRSYFALK